MAVDIFHTEEKVKSKKNKQVAPLDTSQLKVSKKIVLHP